MLLAVDVGNSNVKFAIMDGRDVLSRWRMNTDHNRSSAEYADYLLPLLGEGNYNIDDISGVIISTVVPQILLNLQAFARKFINVEAMLASNANWGIAINVDNPDSVGSDRLVNAIGAHEDYEGELIVISLGTATTMDHIGEDGSYHGGLIAPGMALSRDALANAAAQLPHIDLQRAAHKGVIGKNTNDQILIGLYWGYYALLEGLIDRMRKEIDAPVTIVVTGGLSALFRKEDAIFDHIDPNLTLRGLSILYHRQPQK